MKSYVAVKEKGEVPLGFRLDHALWRDSEALLKVAGEHGRPAACLAWVARMVRDGKVPMDRRFRVSAYGTLPESPMQPANVILWRHERMPIPPVYLADEELTERLVHSVREAEDAEWKLRHVCWRLCGAFLAPDAERKADAKDVDRLLTDLAPGRLYWTRLEEPFRQLLMALPDDPETARVAWRQATADHYRAAFAGAAKTLGTTDRAICAVAQTEGLAEHLIRELIPEEATHGE
jgi:hypothetical protein